ncbi:hypothetical protein BDV96DRAFT_679105 [Lophiotrema nucula]|uniref:Uncharacterized protein n=1 Tax=Lophiotrema nucula TaxID=690887 RepID=A0A6A5ZGF6_9PLEO|nr:hypothetical protein BDV96DRAFT_679105 [Lophiotrema nucula]
MVPRKPTPARSTPSSMPKAARVTKSSRKPDARTRTSGKNAQKAHKDSLQLLQDGRLNVAVVSEHLIDAVRHNATASPLLRLPAELRNKILEYALGGQDVYMELEGVNRRGKERAFTRQRNIISLVYTSRQIYSETAFLPYSSNRFSFPEPDPRHSNDASMVLTTWVQSLLPTQLNTISTIYPGDLLFRFYFFEQYKAPLVSKFPSLARVIITSRTLYWIEISYLWELYPRRYHVDFKDDDAILAEAKRIVEEREGGKVELVLEEDT